MLEHPSDLLRRERGKHCEFIASLMFGNMDSMFQNMKSMFQNIMDLACLRRCGVSEHGIPSARVTEGKSFLVEGKQFLLQKERFEANYSF